MIRQVATLLSGNALSQLVNAATVLLLVSVYFSPDQFGRYAVIMSYVGILSSIGCLRFEMSIVSVDDDRDANNLFFASLVVGLTISATFAFALWFLTTIFADDFLLGSTVSAVAMLTGLRVIDLIFAAVLNRREAYLTISALKLLQAITLFVAVWVAGQREQGLPGLVNATLYAYALYAFGGFVVTLRYRLLEGVSLARAKSLLVKHRDFARFSAPQTLFDNFVSNGINFVLILLAGSVVVGYFNFMQRLVKAPLGLVFGAVSQVVFRYTSKNRDDPDALSRKLREVAWVVGAIVLSSGFAILLLYFVFPQWESLRDWAGLREYMLAFGVWMLAPFLFSPFATLPMVYGAQKQFFLFSMSYNVCSILGLCALIWLGSVNAAFLIVGTISIIYFICLGKWTSGLVTNEEGR